MYLTCILDVEFNSFKRDYRSWESSLLEDGIESLTEELSEVYSDKSPDNYKISVVCAFFFKFFNEVAAKTGLLMVGIFNPHLPSGLVILIKWTSLFPILGVSGVFFHFYSIRIDFPVSKQCRP